MEWESEGVILVNKDFIEGKVIVSVFTKKFGLKKGLCRKKSAIGPGNIAFCRWNARLETHLGTLRGEEIEEISSFLFFKPRHLMILNALLSVLLKVLPENYAKEELYNSLASLLKELKNADKSFYRSFVKFDLLLLKELGFALDLSRCAATGTKEDLFYISPKTGKAVCKSAGEKYHDKLIILPAALHKICKNDQSTDAISQKDFIECIKVANYFLKNFLFSSLGVQLPYYREALVN